MPFLELEKMLTGPHKKQSLQLNDTLLLGLQTRITQQLNEGLSPNDYNRVIQLREATILARKFLRLVVNNSEHITSNQY